MALAYAEIDSNKRKSALLLVFVFAFLIGLGFIFSRATGDSAYAAVWIAIAISLVSASISYFQGDKIALWSSGARPIAEEENKYVRRLVDNLCITAGIPAPKIYVIDDPAINAFATGRKPGTASIAITTGAIQKLHNEELEAVIAHELSHIRNYDIRFMMLITVLVGAIVIMANIFLRSRYFFGGRRDNNGGGGGLAAIFLLVGVLFALISPLIAELIKLAVSRRREYLADASGALLNRFPEGLARALEKIRDENRPLLRASDATAHLFFANPFSGKKFHALFSTHPPIEDRIKKLREMEG